MVNEVTIKGFAGNVPMWATENTLAKLVNVLDPKSNSAAAKDQRDNTQALTELKEKLWRKQI